MKTKIQKSKYYINADSYKKDPEFYEEWTLLSAQEKIAELMEKQNVSKSELAKRLSQSKAHVTNLLSGERNLTLKSFGRICFHLGVSVKSFEMSSINESFVYDDDDYQSFYKPAKDIDHKEILADKMRQAIQNYSKTGSRLNESLWDYCEDNGLSSTGDKAA